MINYGQFCPVAQALEVVGERWTLLVIRELLCGNYRFNQILNGVPLMSRSLLAQRLRALEETGLVERRGSEYHLTHAARELEPIVQALGIWGTRWVQRKIREEDLDPVLLMWDLRRGLDPEQLPPQQTVVRFWLRDVEAKRSRYWLNIQKPEVELCLTNPGFEEKLQVETTARTLAEVWMGHRALPQALRSKAIALSGEPSLVRNFPKWLKLNVFAGVPRPNAPALVPTR
ncbi:MAG TPA: helix-turn-helix domain-containing protein [Polyangiales bacterium]